MKPTKVKERSEEKMVRLLGYIKTELKGLNEDEYPNITSMIEGGSQNAVIEEVLKRIEYGGMTIAKAIINLERGFTNTQ